MDASQQLPCAERFDDIVVGPDFEEQYFIDFLTDRAEDDDRGLYPRSAQLFADFDAGDDRKPEVDQDEIGLLDDCFFEAGLAVGGL
jgi:hypothetical protein